jgi:gluconolactonase
MMLTATAIEGTRTQGIGQLTSGGLAEGTVWTGDSILFTHFTFDSQPPPSEIFRLTPPGPVALAFPPDKGVNGLALDASGGLIGASHAVGGIVRIDAAGQVTPIVSTFNGNRFNSPNDLTARSDGNIYFTDPTFQAPQPNPQPIAAAYRLDPAGTATMIEGSQSLGNPNGISLSPDGNTLYIGHQSGVTRFGVNADGTVMTPGTPFATTNEQVDGMTVDCAGNLYATVHNAGDVRVFDPAGTELGRIAVRQQLTNVAFGGPERRTLYAVGGDPNNANALYSIELAIPGWPY